MKRNVMLVAIAIGSLSAGALAVPGKVGPQTAQEDKHEMSQERNDREDESQHQNKLSKQAKITKEQAQEVALKRAPGTVESGELEREHGKLVYSFDIRNAEGTIDEVQVSAITGKIVRVEHETKEQEEAEKKTDEKKRKN